MEKTFDKTVLNIRPHHLLCTVLYTGSGYSAEFVKNMDEVTKKLKEGTLFKITAAPDMICTHCPNRTEDGGCLLDTESQKNMKIGSLDNAVVNEFNIELNSKIYDSVELFNYIKENITPEFFDLCCGSCRWKKAGLCSFEDYMKRIDDFI